jgi:3',5'-cyclic AMP phosphodiesterase CpdA
VRLIHLTDPHLTNPEFSLEGRSHFGKRYLGRASWRRRRRFKHRREWLDELVAAVHEQQPDLILVTGDLAHIGLPEEIAEAGLWLQQLGTPDQVLLVPGNHDNYAADSGPAIAEHWGAYLGLIGDYPVDREFAELELIGVSSALPTRPASACGLLGHSQLAALDARLAAKKTKPRMLAIHHPPFPGMISFRKRLRDAGALEQLVARQDLDVIVHGHDHTDRAELRAGVRVFGTGSASYQQGSFRRFDIGSVGDSWQIDMSLYCRDSSGDFQPVTQTDWQT